MRSTNFKLNGEVFDNMSPDGEVFFRESDHKYIFKSNLNAVTTSVTTLLHEYCEKFNPEATAKLVCSKKSSPYYGRDTSEVVAEWVAKGVEASSIGTQLHEYGEHLLNYKEQIMKDGHDQHATKPDTTLDHPKCKLVDDVVDHLFSNGYRLAISELLVYDEDLNLAGQSDIILSKEYKAGKKYMIYDWKFLGKPLSMKSFYNPKTGFKKMKAPFNNLMDCNWIHYSIQLAIYQTLSGMSEEITEKVLVVVLDDKWQLVPCHPMRVFWDTNNQLQCVHPTYDGRVYDSRTGKVTKNWPKDIIGI